MYDKKAKKLLPMCLALVLAVGMLSQAAFAADIPGPDDQEITPYTLYIRNEGCTLDISGKTAEVDAWVRGYPGEATKCQVEAELQIKIGSYWDWADSWTDRQDGDWAEVSETAAVIPGETYRVKATVTVWAGSKSETMTIYSDSVTT